MSLSLQLGDLTDLRRRIWRKSHSYRSVVVFERAKKKFEEFLKTNTESDPYKILDNYVAYLDEQGYAPKFIKDLVTWAKVILRQSYSISDEAFKDKVSLPSCEVFMDEKVTEDDLRKLLIHAGKRLKPFIALLKDTAARPIEIIGLQLMHFNFEHNPPYLVIPSYLAKNNIEREVFFTPETKEILIDYLKDRNIKDSEQYVFLRKIPPSDEIGFQKTIESAKISLETLWLRLLSKPAFKHLKVRIKQRGRAIRYKVHIYSLKKFAFTKMADTLGELAAHAIAGHKAYLITYYKKSREERAKDFQKLIPKLSVLTPADLEDEKKREELKASIQGLSGDQLNAILKLARKLASGNRQ